MQEHSDKNVLFIAYHFPPDGAVGARRIERFVKYLPSFGWTPHVLTVKPSYGEYSDSSCSQACGNGVTITRTRMIRSPRQAYLSLKRFLGGKDVSKGISYQANHPTSPPTAKRRSGWKRFLISLLWLPDDKQGWLPFAVASGLRIIRRSHIRCMVSSGPPWTTHLIGLALHRLTGIPWVADFRDPWSIQSWKPDYATTRITIRVESALRRAVYRHAAAVICNTAEAKAELTDANPDISGKSLVITNGFDTEETAGQEPATKEQPGGYRKTLIHAGSLFPGRDPRPLLDAVASLAADHTLTPDKLCLEFIGENYFGEGKTRDLMQKLASERFVKESGLLSRKECLSRLADADGYILVATDQRTQVPAKLYEYMAAGKPILAVTESDSSSAAIVRETRTGVVADWRDPMSMKNSVQQILEMTSGSNYMPDQKRVAQYEAGSLTSRLAELLDSTQN